jgi:glycosyltransferase involved in cell wall biosynthesis
MKILFNTYTMAFQHPGGGEVVILKLKQYLEELGHEVKLFDKWTDKISDYDIIHEFSLLEWEIWKDYKDMGKPLVLTPTAWPRNDLATVLKTKIKSSFRKHNLANFLKYPDLIVPTTALERDRIKNLYGVKEEKFKVLYNGIDIPSYEEKNQFVEETGNSDYLLYVGSIAENKNLLTAIEVAKKTNHKLVIVGDHKVGHEDYYQKCKAHESDSIIFLGRVEQGSSQLTDIYRAAKCLLVLSDFETCSLVALEAGAVATPVIITKHGGTQEVFKDHVCFVEPYSVDDVIRGLDQLKDGDKFKDFVLGHYTWKVIAEKLAEYYKAFV